jgi:hypothetical protein
MEIKILVDENEFFLNKKERPTEAPLLLLKKPFFSHKIEMNSWNCS